MTTLDDLKRELTRRPGFKAEYDALASEFPPLVGQGKDRTKPATSGIRRYKPARHIPSGSGK